jgi:hypothetical protein
MSLVLFEGPTFTMTIESTWIVKANQELQAMFIADKQADEPIFPSLTVAITESDKSLEAHFKQIGEFQADDYPLYEVIEESSQADRLIRHYQWKHPSSEAPIQQAQHFLMDENNVIYTLTTTYLAAQESRIFDQFETALNSFSFT